MRIILFLSVLLTFASIFTSCSSSKDEDFVINPEFTAHIGSFTSGVISAQSTIDIELIGVEVEQSEIGKELSEELFKFSPKVKGKIIWKNASTISFVPDQPFKSGETYTATFFLYKVKDVENNLADFEFRFTIVNQAVNVMLGGLQTYSVESSEWQQLQGTIVTADVISEEQLAKVISINLEGKKTPFKVFPTERNTLFKLVVDSLKREKQSKSITVKWDGSVYGFRGKGELSQELPALGEYKLMDIQMNHHPDQYVLVRFSDPLNPNQNLDGLISLDGNYNVRTAISTNELRIYPISRLTGNKLLTISGKIKNISNFSLGDDVSEQVTFEAIKPAVKWVGKGTILPSSNQNSLAFEAVNLKAVDVRIIKVYENNINQFFQNNNYAGNSEIKRVGRVIRKKTVYLDQNKPINFGNWNRFNLDLSEYIKVDPGAIYRVELGFRKHHATYPCDGEQEVIEGMDEKDWDEYDDTEKDVWDYYSDYSFYYHYNDYFRGYQYNKRENPCSYSYYRNRRVVKNVFATDLGIISKVGNEGSLSITVTNLISTAPENNAEVEIFDFQQQLLYKGTTDSQGFLTVKKLKKTPFFVVVKKNNQKAYLRLDNGSSQSLSRFDVSGAIVQEGIKGFIYGERGVWRPGDSLHLNFILEDKEGLLPQKHPVIFELYNPNNQLVNRMVRHSAIGGFYNFSTFTESDAPTGNWTANVLVGGATFRKNIKIETVKPNRLKIKLNLEDDLLSSKHRFLKGDLAVTWLHGSPAKDLKTDISINLFPTRTYFEKAKDFKFDDPIKQVDFEERTIYKGKLDQEGKAKINTLIDVETNAPGMLKAVIKTRAFEKSGDFSTDQFTVPYAPYETFVGVRSPEIARNGALETDTTYGFDLVTLDKHGKPVPNTSLEVTVYKIEWRWWWEQGVSNLAHYIGRSSVRPVKTLSQTTDRSGKAKVNLRFSSNQWGRYLIRVQDKKGGHATGIVSYFDWPSWMSRAGRSTPDGANMLVFSSDKDDYKVGETAKISFPSSENGRALISIENGKKVIDAFWVQTTSAETSFSLPITAEFTPNCYVHITMIQPHSQTENDAPIRLYGVIPLGVTNPATQLKPKIELPKELAPESSFKLKVTEEQGRKMTYTVAIVDEGLLDITRFKTPNPWKHFYSREALGVKTWDTYDWVIGAYGAKIEHLLTVGGDADLAPGEEKPIRFKPMVKFLGPFELEKGKTAVHDVYIPNYIGSVRTMIVAGDNEGAYGSSEQTSPVKKPLMVLATLPRVLGPGERVKLPVNVFAMDDKIKDVSITVKTNDLLNVSTPKKQLRFDSQGDEVVEFDVEVSNKKGKATVQISAKSGSETSEYEIELEVRSPNEYVQKFDEVVLESGLSWSFDKQLFGVEGTKTATLEVSSIPPINLSKRLDYLIRYPHGCIEQTTSGAFPQLYLEKIVELTPSQKDEVKTHIIAALNKIKTHQLHNGGLSYWSGSNTVHDWATTYAGHFILEAEKNGYALPFGLKQGWINYQKSNAQQWRRSSSANRNEDVAQAYRLYTLALAGSPDLAAMNRLREDNNLSITGAWRLAAAYQLLGKTEVAKALVNNKATAIQPYQELAHTFGSKERDMAMIIETLTLLNEKVKAAPLIKELSEVLSSDKWLNTQATAYSLKAIADFSSVNKDKQMQYSYSYTNQNQKRVNNKQLVDIVPLSIKQSQERLDVKISNEGNDILFVRLVSGGVPLVGEEVSYADNLKLDVVYKTIGGSPLSIEQLEQGTDFVAEVTVSNPGMKGNYYELALTQIFPSGWEIRNTRMDIGGDESSDDFNYQDIRDDRVMTYFDLQRNTFKTFKVILHAAYVGEYYLPPVRCEAMYDQSIQALIKGKWINVKKPGK